MIGVFLDIIVTFMFVYVLNFGASIFHERTHVNIYKAFGIPSEIHITIFQRIGIVIMHTTVTDKKVKKELQNMPLVPKTKRQKAIREIAMLQLKNDIRWNNIFPILLTISGLLVFIVLRSGC